VIRTEAPEEREVALAQRGDEPVGEASASLTFRSSGASVRITTSDCFPGFSDTFSNVTRRL